MAIAISRSAVRFDTVATAIAAAAADITIAIHCCHRRRYCFVLILMSFATVIFFQAGGVCHSIHYHTLN